MDRNAPECKITVDELIIHIRSRNAEEYPLSCFSLYTLKKVIDSLFLGFFLFFHIFLMFLHNFFSEFLKETQKNWGRKKKSGVRRQMSAFLREKFL